MLARQQGFLLAQEATLASRHRPTVFNSQSGLKWNNVVRQEKPSVLLSVFVYSLNVKKPSSSSKTASTLISLSTVWLPLTSCISSLFSSGAFQGSWQQLLPVDELDFRVKNLSNPAAVQAERNVKQIKWNCRVNVTLWFCHLFPLSVFFPPEVTHWLDSSAETNPTTQQRLSRSIQPSPSFCEGTSLTRWHKCY